MKSINFSRQAQRRLRAKRFTKKLRNAQLATDKPVLVVTKTNAHLWVQLIDYNTNKTIASSSSVQLKLKNGNKENAKLIGEDIAKKALKLNVKKVIFHRNGSVYHGRVEAVAEAARAAGLEF